MSVLKIRCSDGLLVEVDLEVAKKFGTLKDMLFAVDFQADQEVPLNNVSSKTLEKIVKFVETPEDNLDKVKILLILHSSLGVAILFIKPSFMKYS